MTDAAQLTGKTVVVTGASSGLGRGAALQLAASGANVVAAARRGGVLDELVAEITASGGTAVAVSTDVSDPDAVARLAGTARDRFGRIDVWINDVGIGALGSFWDVPVADHARVVAVNLTGLMYGAHAAIRQFIAQGRGTLVNVGSVEADVPLAYQSSYAATKAAILTFGRCLNEELRLADLHERIRVSTIMPWALDTPFWSHAGNYTGRTLRMATMADPRPAIDAIVAACTDPQPEHRVGAKAHVAGVAARVASGPTDRVSALVADSEAQKGMPVAPTSGSIHAPTEEGTSVEGGIRQRMKAEDATPHS